VDCSSISIDPKAFSRRKHKLIGQEKNGKRRRRRKGRKDCWPIFNQKANPLGITDQISLPSVIRQIFLGVG